jgi:Uncharacterized conserved protein
MARIKKIDLEHAPESVRRAAAAHTARGYRITNEKLTLLHDLPAFEALEEGSYALDRELQRLIGKRAADFFEYAISVQNGCAVCTAYFSKLLRKNGIDFETFAFTGREQLLVEYGQAIARDPKKVPEELFGRLRREFSEEELVAITAMGVLIAANNAFNDLLQVEPEPLDE